MLPVRRLFVFGMLASLMMILRFSAVAGDLETAPSDEKTQLVRVCTLNSVEANQEFQRNVQIVQAQRQRIVNLQGQLDRSQTEELREVLQKELDRELEKLQENNQKMAETYGFSLNRNYLLVTEKAHVYMVVSDEEAARLKAVEETRKPGKD